MNRPANTRLPIVAAAILGLLTPLVPARGQDGTPAPQPVDATFARTFSVEFPGGTVAEYLDAIRAAFPGVNIVGSQGLDEFTLPAISLKEVTIAGALEPLEQVAMTAVQGAKVKVRFGSGVASIAAESIYDGSPLYSDEETPKGPQIVTRIWNVTALTTGGGMTIADITGAIETAVSIASDAKPEFRIHEPTGTLVVKGLDTQLDLIDEVIGKLHESASELDNLRSQVIDLRGEVAMWQVEVANGERQLAEREKQAAAATDEDERNHRTDEALELRGALEKARVNLSEMQARLADLESRVKKPNP
jgi:hypothetical protein